MREVNPMNTDRAASWQLYIDSPMPMVTVFKTLELTNLIASKAKGYRLNMLLCYCIGLAASRIPEFRLLPVGKKMMEYDKLGVNVIVANRSGGINSCDIPILDDLDAFNASYLELTRRVQERCENHEIPNRMIIGTSSLVQYDIAGVVNMYSGIFNNPFLIWGKYRTEGDKNFLPISFQFHHVQMDGIEACEFLERLQESIRELNV